MKQVGFLGVLLALALTVGTQVGCGADGEAGVYFSDDFTTPSGWEVRSDPEVEIGYADGGLSILVKVTDRVAWTVVGRDFQDGVVSVDATPVGGPNDNAYGLIVRHVDDRNFYRFEVSGDGYFAVQVPQGSLGWEFLVDWTESSAIHQGRETNHLAVVCQGDTMTFYANDVQLTQVVDGRYREGDVGLIAGTFYTEPGTHIMFDNFQVEPMEDDE